MSTSTKRKGLLDAYRFPGCRPQARLRGVFGDPKARVITLTRRSKKRFAAAVLARTRAGTTGVCARFAISPAAMRASTWSSRFGAFSAEVAGA